MKSVFHGFVIAFSMYSSIPMPRVSWEKENMRWALCFFPLVGICIGFIQIIWRFLSVQFSLGGFLFAAISTMIPVLVTGGIHLDGFTDVCDAWASQGNIEKRLSIMKDPHIGAFGVIDLVVLLLLQFGLYAELYHTPSYIVLPILYALSRVMSAYAVVSVPCAKSSGLAYIFSAASEKKTVQIVLAVEWLALIGTVAFVSARLGCVCGGVSLACFFIFCSFTHKEFGGITGDLAGFFSTVMETIFLVLLIGLGG